MWASDESNEKTGKYVKLQFTAAVISLLNYIETVLDSMLLLESEKDTMYWAFDTRELTRGSLAERCQAYHEALTDHWMQVDEVRKAEDLDPTGFNWMQLGLGSVLLNPQTMEVFTPNTGQTANLNGGEFRADYLELRFRKNQKRKLNGQFDVENNSSESIDNSGKDAIINNENAGKELDKAIADGKLTTKLDKKAQSAHKKGSAEYNKRIANGEFPSYTEMSNMEIQKVINEHSRKGITHKGKDGQFREVIQTDDFKGMFGNRETKKYVPTNRGTIHYSKNGTHIVPAAPIK